MTIAQLSRLQRSDKWECIHFWRRAQDGDIADLAGLGFFVASITDKALRSDDALFHALHQAFAFPDDVGHNWDALDELLADLEWCPSPGYVLVIEFGRSPKLTLTFGRLVEVWLTAAQDWSRRQTPFHLVCLMRR
jgi:RNAse (barnase) inhibitor barstar